MKFNIAFMGGEKIYQQRRDFILLLKYSLEDLGHDVTISQTLYTNRFNLIIGMYFMPKEKILAVANSGLDYAAINTEIIGDDLLNYKPEKVDFLGAYLPFMAQGRFIWDVVKDNLEQYKKYDLEAHFLRWEYHPKLEEIEHRKDKDIDFYFFGSFNDYRKEIFRQLLEGGLQGVMSASNPYFERNDFISRSKVNISIGQGGKFNHVPNFRLCYLANNNACIVSEPMNDPGGYLEYTEVCKPETFVKNVKSIVHSGRWKKIAEEKFDKYRQTNMKQSMQKMLDKCL